MAAKWYRVLIPYREPTYELRTGGPREKPFVAAYRVRAEDSRQARHAALELFQGDLEESGVRWAREPVMDAIEVCAL